MTIVTDELINEFQNSDVETLLTDEAVNFRWGKYRKIQVLHKGSSNATYLVDDTETGYTYVLKETPYVSGVTKAEDSILSRLSHDGIPKLIDSFQYNGKQVTVEEYIHGETLEISLERAGLFPEDTVIDWGIQLCEILGYLHNQKPYPVVHRDIKPSNIICSVTGNLKLIDFDAAREYKPEASKDTQNFGTMGYAAPEQFGFSQTDPKTDIFSLGILMYQLLTGKSPDRGIPPEPMRKVRKILSMDIEKIVSNCMKFNPTERYDNTDLILKDLLKLKRKRSFWREHWPAIAISSALATTIIVSAITSVVVTTMITKQDSNTTFTGKAAATISTSSPSTAKSNTGITKETDRNESTTAIISEITTESTDKAVASTGSPAIIVDNTAAMEQTNISSADMPQEPATSLSKPVISLEDYTGLLFKCKDPVLLRVNYQMGTTGDSGPDLNGDGINEILSFAYQDYGYEYYAGWKGKETAFNLLEAIPPIAYGNDGKPRKDLIIELTAIDLDGDDVNEVVLAAGNLTDKFALSVVYLDDKKQFKICPDIPSGSRLAYLDAYKRIVFPSDTNDNTVSYRFENKRLILDQ